MLWEQMLQELTLLLLQQAVLMFTCLGVTGVVQDCLCWSTCFLRSKEQEVLQGVVISPVSQGHSSYGVVLSRRLLHELVCTIRLPSRCTPCLPFQAAGNSSLLLPAAVGTGRSAPHLDAVLSQGGRSAIRAHRSPSRGVLHVSVLDFSLLDHQRSIMVVYMQPCRPYFSGCSGDWFLKLPHGVHHRGVVGMAHHDQWRGWCNQVWPHAACMRWQSSGPCQAET